MSQTTMVWEQPNCYFLCEAVTLKPLQRLYVLLSSISKIKELGFHCLGFVFWKAEISTKTIIIIIIATTTTTTKMATKLTHRHNKSWV